MTKATFKHGAWHVGNEKLTPSEAKIFVPLLFKPSIHVSNFIEALYPHPDDEPDWAENTIGVYICTLNKKLVKCKSGHRIKGDGRKRYTLERLPVQAGGA